MHPTVGKAEPEAPLPAEEAADTPALLLTHAVGPVLQSTARCNPQHTLQMLPAELLGPSYPRSEGREVRAACLQWGQADAIYQCAVLVNLED